LPNRFEPKLLTILREGYTRDQFVSDLTAGVIVGIVALPLAIAFAIASGVKPEAGLFTAIVAGVIVSALGGSRVQIAGPTGAFIVIVYGIVRTYGYDGMMVATMMAGVMLMVMGFARFGTLLKFVPYPLIVGFTSGIALIIFSSQVNDFFGLRIENLPADFVGKWAEYASGFARTDPVSVAVGAGSLVVILIVQRLGWRLPGSLLALVLATAAVQSMHLQVETIGSRFGDVPTMLPAPRLPSFAWNDLVRLFSPAVTIALLGSIESLLSAVVADGMIRSRHRPNVELVAQGVANIFSPIFSGIPATGAIARTATNVKNGGRTPVAGIIHAVVLLLIMLFFGKWATLIPMPALAAILVVVAYNMSEWRSFRKILRAPRSDITVMLVTFFLTVVVDLTVAIQMGVILSAMFFIRRMAEVSQVTSMTKDLQDVDEADIGDGGVQKVPDGVEVFEVYGSLFFGAVDQFTETIRELRKKPKVFILETKNLLAIDATGLQALEDLLSSFRAQGTTMVISGIHKQPLFAIVQAGLMDRIGEDNVCGSLEEALGRARELTAAKP
jgi:sulfate permease, SulP family